MQPQSSDPSGAAERPRGDDSRFGRDEAPRRADRDGHGIRLPLPAVAEEAGVDVVLVGDTAAMVVLGYDATTPVGMDEMLTMAAAVRRGLRDPLLIGDMPFGSYERSNEHAIENAQRFVKEAGCDAVKLERGGPSVERARGDRRVGHPGHGTRRADSADGDRARRLQGPGATAEPRRRSPTTRSPSRRPGCFAIVFEAVPAAVAER